MNERFWHAVNVAMPSAWLTALLPDPTYHLVALAGVVVGVMLLSFWNLVGRADDFLRCGAIRAWRAVVLAVAKFLISLEVRVAAMVARIAADIAAHLAARRPEPPPAPRNLPSVTLVSRLVPIPVLGRA